MIRRGQTPSPDRARLLAALARIDGVLVQHGFPPTSPWWCRELRRFLTSGRRRWVIRAGRRAGKSSTLCRLAVAVAVAGEWRVPPGDVAVVAFVSVDRGEAAGRLRTIRAILDALGVTYAERGDEIALASVPLVFRVVTCSIQAGAGFTCVLYIGDEVSRWPSDEGAANPAEEVLAALRPTMATQPTAFEVVCSSPRTKDDYHAQLVAKGDDDHQVVSIGTTWECNPTLTEADCRALEPDARAFRREYAAEPADAVSAAFPDGVDHCVARGIRRRARIPGGRHGVALDVGLRHDRTAIVAFHVELRSRDAAPPLRHLVVDALEWLKPGVFGLRHVQMSDVEERVVSVCREYGATKVVSDSREAASLGERLRARGITLTEMGMAPSHQEKRAAVLVGHVGAGTLDLIDDRDLVVEMNQAEMVLSGGRWLISAPRRRSAHDDGLDCLLLACEVAATLPASGGDIECDERLYWLPDAGGLHVDRTWRRRLEDGTFTPTSPPAGTIDAEQAREARFRQGFFTPADLADLGEDEVARRIAAGGGDVDPGDYGEAGPSIVLPPDPAHVRIGGWNRY